MPTLSHRDPLFDLVSHARHGPPGRVGLSAAQLQQIARTVRRAPEVMVKVLPRGAIDLKAVRKHLDYIGRKGELDLETDDGENLRGARVGQGLLEDWDLDLDAQRRKSDLVARPGKQLPRLVHKLMFSMPAGTPPDKVFEAVRNFCREEFALKHRYAMALHTNEPHPHVHVVVKAVSEQGQRLNMRNATLREWRAGFAQHLRAVGVAANATTRQVRGESRPRKSDGIYRAAQRGESTHMHNRAQAVASELSMGHIQIEPGRSKLLETRAKVEHGWRAVIDILREEGQLTVAAEVQRFIQQMPSTRTEKEWLASDLVERARHARNRGRPPAR